MNALAQLAAEMVPCPERYWWADKDTIIHGAPPPKLQAKSAPHEKNCICKGSGQVPLIPGLRVPCTNGFCPTTAGHSVPCPCHGLGYTLVSEDTALLVLMEWCKDNGYTMLLGWAGVNGQLHPVVSLLASEENAGQGLPDACLVHGATIPEALAAAVAQALGLEVKAS